MIALAATTLVAAPAQAAMIFYGERLGQVCDGPGGFSACYASSSGVVDEDGDGRSPSIYRLGARGGSEISTLFPTIDGPEFDVDYLAGNVLTFTYAPGTDDPDVHWFTIERDGAYLLFYDDVPITSGMVNLDNHFQQQSWTRITFFNSGSSPGVPEPATWATLLIGFGAIGATLRARTARRRVRLQAA
jgi:hypothetical protein